MASNTAAQEQRSRLLVVEDQDTATHARAFVNNADRQQQQQRRPPYPSFVKHVLPHLLRIPLSAAWSWAFHTFIMKPWLGPVFYYCLVEHRTVQRLVNETEWMNQYVWPWLQAQMDHCGLDHNDVILYSVGSNLVHILAYTLINGCYLTLDTMGWCAQYRIPQANNKPPPPELIWDTLAKITETFLFSGPLASVYLLLYMSRYPHIASREDFLEWNNDTPVLVQMLHFAGMLLFTQFFFYWAHRGFHQVPGVYRRFHKQHQYQAALSISAEYAHPLEQVIANFAPTIGYNLIWSRVLPVSVWFSYMVCRLHDTFETHSGYDFRGTLLHRIGFFCGGTYWHENHHRKNRGIYGEFYLDWFFGTMDPFLVDTQRIQAPAQKHREW